MTNRQATTAALKGDGSDGDDGKELEYVFTGGGDLANMRQGACEPAAVQVCQAECDSISTSEDPARVPAYTLHPDDLALISLAASSLKLSLAEYAQLAPYLYAKWCMRRSDFLS